ncbi:MAG: nucleotidyltransferase family protein, partial [Armatimonadetes bacterium]|nr:nucleotidyltransferase family protein [Armatimonadota bacterium]
AALVLTADLARRQLVQIGDALARRGLRAIAMKGASHTLALYTGALPRNLSDLDLVVRPSVLDAACTALLEIGFEPEPWNSPEDILLQAQEGPGLRCLREGKLPVDLQTRLPGLPADGPALEEAWAAARAAQGLSDGSDGSDESDRSDPSDPSDPSDRTTPGLLILRPMHEFLLAAAHLQVHLRPPLTVSPKWITDMLLLVRLNSSDRPPRIGPPIVGDTFAAKLAQLRPEELIWPFADEVGGASGERLWRWSEFWSAAGRWGIRDQCAAACATLNAHWNAGIPDVPPDAEPLPLARLFENDADHALRGAATVPSAYMERLARFRSLPGARARARYLLSLAFPSEASLRRRYGLAPDAWIVPWRVAHPFRTAAKLARGIGAALWIRLRRGS